MVNGVLQEEVLTDSRSLYAAHPVYRETAAQLHSMPAKLVGPVGLLYVQQREMAATLPHDSKCTMRPGARVERVAFFARQPRIMEDNVARWKRSFKDFSLPFFATNVSVFSETSLL